MTSKRTAGFYQIDNSLIDEYGPKIGVYGVAVYNVLAKYANGDGGDIFPAYQTIANHLGISRQKVMQTIRQLCDLGLISKQSRMRKAGGQTSNVYQLRSTQHVPPSTQHVPHGVHDVDQGGTQHVPDQYPIEQDPQEQDPVRGNARETQQPAKSEAPTPPPKKPPYKNSEHRRAQMNVAEALKIGMDKRQLLEWTNWVLEQAGQTAIADAAEDDSRIGQAQLTAISLYRLGNDTMDGLKDIRSWLDKSWQSAPYYPKNLEDAASAIVAGTPPPGADKPNQPPVSQTEAAFSMEALTQ